MSPSDRQTGKTTRVLLRALLAASEGAPVVTVVVPTVMMAKFTFARLHELAYAIRSCSVSTALMITLPNGSKIQVVTKEKAFKNGVLCSRLDGPVFFDEVDLLVPLKNDPPTGSLPSDQVEQYIEKVKTTLKKPVSPHICDPSMVQFHPLANTTQEWGIDNGQDAILFGYQGLQFGKTVRKGGKETFTPMDEKEWRANGKIDWSEDALEQVEQVRYVVAENIYPACYCDHTNEGNHGVCTCPDACYCRRGPDHKDGLGMCPPK